MFDADKLYEQTQKDLEAFEIAKREPARVRIWDGDWNQFAEVEVYYDLEVTFEYMEAGSGSLSIPLSSPVAQAMLDPDSWPTKSMYVTVDKDGARWSGRVENATVSVDYTGEQQLELALIHDYVKLKELLVWSNPFLPAGVQFPKAWLLFGPSRWSVATTLFVNLLRKNTSSWMVPDDPLDIGQWFDLDMSNWSMAVKPVSFVRDNSLTTIISSRFKYFHDCVEDICRDAQLSIECRRYLPGDPPPIPGANLRYGCLVYEVVDKSGWNKPTSIGGSLVGGLNRVVQRVLSDGMTETLDYLPRVDHPDEYYKVGFLGTMPEAPWVVLEHGEHTGMEATNYEYVPPGPSQFVTGGSSMPGVNEALKSSVIGIGGFIGSLFNFNQAGSIAATILEPLYSDVFAAFMAHKDRGRIRQQGWDFPFEKWVDGSDQAYTLGSMSGMRKAKYETRERHSVQVDMVSGAPYWVGQLGHGDFFIGDRVAVHALGMPEDRLFVEMVESLTYSESDDERGWEIEVGETEFASGLEYMSRRADRLRQALQDQGVW